jgi:hypothetical protein
MRHGRRVGGGWLKWLYAALFAAFMVGCGDDVTPPGEDASGVIRNQGGDKVRLRAPLSGSVSGSRQPVFAFVGGRDARVDICYDRACDHVLESLEGHDGEAQPETPLPAGTFFWRAVTRKRASATWQLVIPTRESGLTTASATVPDYNGDGFADVAIGVPVAGAGSVPILFGSFSPSPTLEFALVGSDAFGRAIAAVGDLNGDGFVDLAVASGSAPGTVTIYNGGAGGPTMGITLLPGPVTSGFGTTMASAGDVNGDGYGDVIVGGGEVAQVFFGGASCASAEAALALAGPLGGNALIVQGPGDVNGDGAPDVAVGGAIYLGDGTGFTLQADFVPSPNAAFAGDHDGDGLTDFTDDQAVVPGTPAGVDRNQDLLNQAGNTMFATAGDIDGDGYWDVLATLAAVVGVPERERVYFGAPTACGTNDCRPFAPIVIPGHDHSAGSLRAIIAAAGDINGDGGDDLVVSTPDNGRVFIYLAGDARVRPLAFPFPTFSASPGFGSSLAALFGTATASP